MCRLLLLGIALVSGCTFLYEPPKESEIDTGRDGGAGDGGSSSGFPVVRITDNDGASRLPSLTAWQDGFAVAWQDDRAGQEEIFAVPLSAGGEKLGGDVRVTTSLGASERPALVAPEGGFVATWQDRRAGSAEIYFAELDTSGTKQGDSQRVTNDPTDESQAPSAVSTGGSFGVAWSDRRDGNYEIYFAEIEPGDTSIAVHRLTKESSPSTEPALAWSGSELAVAWQDRRPGQTAIFFGRLTADGTALAAEAQVTEGPAAEAPALVTAGEAFALAWQQDADGDGNHEIYLARLDATGAPLGEPVQVAAPSGGAVAPSLAWTGSELGVAWQDARHGSAEIYLARIGTGDEIIQEIRVTDDDAASISPSVAWRDGSYAVAWQDQRDGNEEIYAALITP